MLRIIRLVLFVLVAVVALAFAVLNAGQPHDRHHQSDDAGEHKGAHRDVIGFARDGDDACVTLLKVRGGMIAQTLSQKKSDQITVNVATMRKDMQAMLDPLRTATQDQNAKKAASDWLRSMDARHVVAADAPDALAQVLQTALNALSRT